MANENIQELKFQVGEVWKGVYSSSTTYGLANVVQDPTGLSIYRSLKSGNVGHPLSDSSWWFRIIDLSSIKAESDRIAALNQSIAQDEALRVAAEELRQQHEAERVAAETQRNEAEQARVNAEQERVGAESARATAEQQRITAEQERVSAESARVQAEQARVLSETLRANAEDQRAANEQNRIAAEQQRIERAEQDHQRAESDHATYVDSLGAFDISSYHATDGVLAKYADLAAALGTNGANIPDDLRKGGMSVKFVQSSDNKYVQYRLMLSTYTDAQFSNAGNWQGIDKVPKTMSSNLVESGGVADIIDALIGSEDANVDLSVYTETDRTIGYSTGLWQNDTPDYQHIVLPVKVGRSYVIISNGGISLQYTLLKSYSAPVTGQSADFCNGWSVIQKSIGVSDKFIVPSDCAFLYIRTKNAGNQADVSLTLKGVEGEIESIKVDISRMESDMSNINNDVDTIQDDIKEILGEPAAEIDLFPYTSNPYLGKLDFTSPYGWSGTSASNNKKHIIVPVLTNTSYTILAKDTGTLSLRYAFLKSYTGTSSSPDYCEGFDRPYVVAKGISTNVITPSDCTCLYLQYQDGASATADLAVTKNATDGRLGSFEDELDSVEGDITKIKSMWNGKKIAWFGTSIPAGSNFSIPIKANAIDAYITAYKVEKTILTENDNLPCEYPVIAASLLGANTIYNEAVGSSRIVKNTTDTSLLIRCKALTNTVEEICSYIWGSYIIDITNQTFEENHNNTIGITTFLPTAGTWSSFVNNVMICLSQSYQIKLTLRHLISDSTQRSNYVNDVFGTYYNDVVSMLSSVGYTLADLVGYGETDLFVLEHSVNDNNPSMDYPVTSTDVTTFQGAYNKIIGEILRYKPSTRIVIVSNYGPDSTEHQYNKDKAAKLQEIAEHWQIAFCEMRKHINVSWTPQLTQGYWDNNGYWHDSGFEWVEDVANDSFTTNAYFHPDLYSSSLATIKQNINPQQIHGVWYWEAPSPYIWMKDRVHPHSDKEGRLCIILAKILYKWLDMQGNL